MWLKWCCVFLKFSDDIFHRIKTPIRCDSIFECAYAQCRAYSPFPHPEIWQWICLSFTMPIVSTNRFVSMVERCSGEGSDALPWATESMIFGEIITCLDDNVILCSTFFGFCAQYHSQKYQSLPDSTKVLECCGFLSVLNAPWIENYTDLPFDCSS